MELCLIWTVESNPKRPSKYSALESGLLEEESKDTTTEQQVENTYRNILIMIWDSTTTTPFQVIHIS